ncbi:MAG: Serine/threonine-protein kinase PknD [Phycisphaerae bacterium]|nr:Serine/threonine-protein kinase PknD [Phycisphaerae bacterium]
MTPERHQQAMEVFGAAVELAPDSRAAFVRRQCGTDAELFDEVSSLLKWDVAGAPTELGVPGPASKLEPPAELPDRIGPYEVTGLLGLGGMSIVYRARQRHPERAVALKVMRPAEGGSVELSRFRREINVLARLRHPGIAPIYGAGTAVLDGSETQYFAMELVDGEALTVFADAHSLDRNQRVELLLRVCEAVSYAHQHGIIHRDLKPANVLVERTPDGGRPRVLDFGIARLLESHDDGAAFVTREHRIVGTLAYMSPERFDPDGANDTRVDVYALGAIAYELLGGRPPLDVARLSTVEAIQRIQQESPAPLGRLNPTCGGDLSLIVDKALAKLPGDRYASVEALAHDLRAFLQNRPIRARGIARLYTLRKFVRRNRLAVALTGIVVLVAIAGGLGTARGLLSARRANRELQNQLAETTESARFLVREVVSGLDSVAGTAEIRRALLDRLVAQIEMLRARDPFDDGLMEDHAAALTSRSDALVLSERLDEALEDRQEALRLRQALSQREPGSHARRAEVSLALVRVGDVHNGRNELDSTLAYYKQAYAIDNELVQAEPDSVRFLDNLAFSYDRLGWLAMRRDEYNEAAEHFQARLAITNQLLRVAPDRDATRHGCIMVYGYLADVASRRSDLQAAEQHRREAHAAARRLAADRPNNRLYADVLVCASRELATLLMDAGRLSEAAEFLDEAVSAASHLYEADPHDFHPANLYFGVLRLRAELALSQGDEVSARRALDAAQSLVQSDAIRTAGNGVPGACAEHLLELNARLEPLQSTALRSGTSLP